MIRFATPSDSDQIVEIYNHYVLNTIITFEEDTITSAEMSERIRSTLNSGFPWLVAEQAGEILGYAYASKWKERGAYRHSVESTVYLNSSSYSKGWGSKLYLELLKSLKERNFHVVMGGIALPNPLSIRLHEKCGFEKVAHFKEVGYKFDNWVDVGYWQIKLNNNP